MLRINKIKLCRPSAFQYIMQMFIQNSAYDFIVYKIRFDPLEKYKPVISVHFSLGDL